MIFMKYRLFHGMTTKTHTQARWLEQLSTSLNLTKLFKIPVRKILQGFFYYVGNCVSNDGITNLLPKSHARSSGLLSKAFLSKILFIAFAQQIFHTQQAYFNEKSASKEALFSGAAGRGRTDTVLLPRDFESRTSANSITAAFIKLPIYYTPFFFVCQSLILRYKKF